MSDTRFHTMPDGPGKSDRRIAFRFAAGAGPTLVFLPGYKSDMAGSKACTLFDWAKAHGLACLLLDYSGCGQSSGNFADGTLSRWKAEVLALIEAHCPGQVVLVGSSMGGWLMLLVALARPKTKVAGLLGIAPAPDFTEWGVAPDDKARLMAGKIIWAENAYGPEPTPTHPGFWADGQANLLLGAEIPLTCPVRLLHGQADPDVPWSVSLQLADALRSAKVQVTLVKDGDHRLSRAADIALMLHAATGLVEPF